MLPRAGWKPACREDYSAAAIEVKVAMRLEESKGSTVMMARHVAAAIKPYSMAVAPDSFLRNLNMS
jgi:hypothetical protein